MPLARAVAVLLPIQPAVMFTRRRCRPGCRVREAGPVSILTAATVMALGSRAGDWLQALTLLLPAETT